MNWSTQGMTKIVKKSDRVTSNEVRSAKTKDLNFHASMTELLVSHDETVEDKIATLKTAQHVDKGRFENAFKTLMKR